MYRPYNSAIQYEARSVWHNHTIEIHISPCHTLDSKKIFEHNEKSLIIILIILCKLRNCENSLKEYRTPKVEDTEYIKLAELFVAETNFKRLHQLLLDKLTAEYIF